MHIECLFFRRYNFNQISVEYLTLCCTNNLNIEDVNESSKHRKSWYNELVNTLRCFFSVVLFY